MRGPTLPDSFVHLHLHTEYSMLDGASRIGEVVAAAAADGQPAVGITDHGNMYGVLRAVRRRRATPASSPCSAWRATSPNTSRFDRPEALRARDLPPHDARRDRTRATATSSRSRAPRTSTATTTSPAATGSCSSAITRASPRPRAASAGSCSQLILQGRSRSRARSGGAVPGHLRARALLRRAAGPRHRRRRAGRSARCSTSRASSTRRCSRRTTATTRTRKTPRRTTRCCACRPARCRATRIASSSTATTSTSRARPRCATLFREAPEACDNTLLVAERADGRARVRQRDPPVVPGARRATTRTRTCASSRSKARRSATAQSPALHVLERIEYELDVIKSMGFSAYFLVVWDLVRYAKSRSIRVGPGRGSAAGFVRRVLPAHRRHRPDQVRPALRAVPQPGPQGDARHRHGLRLALPRRDDQVRRAEVRQRPRRAGRHVLDDQGAGRGARRGARARLPVRGSATRSRS